MSESPGNSRRSELRREIVGALDRFNAGATLEMLGPQELNQAEHRLLGALQTVEARTWDTGGDEESVRGAVYAAELERNDYWDACIRALGGYRDGPRPDPAPPPREFRP